MVDYKEHFERIFKILSNSGACIKNGFDSSYVYYNNNAEEIMIYYYLDRELFVEMYLNKEFFISSVASRMIFKEDFREWLIIEQNVDIKIM